MRHLLITSLLLLAGCAGQAPSPEALAALRSEFASPSVAVDIDCIFSGPVKNEYRAYRHFGLCLFSDKELRLYFRGEQPKLAYAWSLGKMRSYALHGNIFTVVADAGNFGLVVKERAALAAALRSQGVHEDTGLPEFSSKDLAPWYPFSWHPL